MSFEKTVPLNDFITLQRGFDLPKDTRSNGTVPVVASTGITGYHDEVKAVAPGVVIGRSGSIGGGQYITEDFWPLNTTLWVKDFKGHHPRYVYYLLRSIDFNQFNVGTGVPTLNRNHLTSVLVADSGWEKEKRIAEILGDLDDKIELNRQTNQTLEQIAQTLFKSWFVDFEPVKAKITAKQAGACAEQIERAALCAISGKTPEQLAQLNPQTLQQFKTTAALFPDALVDSELGEIPKGWEVKLNGDVMDVRDGTHDSPKQSETGFPLITSKHITSGVLDINDAYLISEDDYQKINKRSQVNQGDILLTMIGTVGLSYLVMQPTVNFAIKNVGLFRTSEVKELKNYFYLLLKSHAMQGYLDARMVGTTQKYLSLKTLRSIEMIMPSIELLRAFNVQVNPIMDKVFELLQENESLNQLKDALLPKLLDGSIALEEFVGS